MCGFAGLWTTQPGFPLAEFSRHARSALRLRGPDADGEFIDEAHGLALVHTRLSILDLSPAGAQPMRSACGRFVISFNGEIYNHADLGAELRRDGWVPRGHSDTEVLVEGIARYGLERTLERSHGMFAFAVWDAAQRTLTLARDRLGEKPLFYGRHAGGWWFGSELKAFLGAPGFSGCIDSSVLGLYLRHGYVPEPHCILEGFSKLAPGEYAVLESAAAQAVVRKTYWSLDTCIAEARRDPFRGNERDAIEALDAQLHATIRRQMVADVPVGAFLSGGVDSSTVVAVMQAESSRPVHTFSIGFDIAAFDESAEAARVAEHLGTHHTALRVTSEEARAVIPRLPEIYDEPFADSSQIPTCLVSELARRDVTVSMSGDAGDELFGGYNRYFLAVDAWRGMQRWPRWMKRLCAGGLTALSPRQWDILFRLLRPLLPGRLRQAFPGQKLHKLAAVMNREDPRELYMAMLSLWSRPQDVARNAGWPRLILDDWRIAPGVDDLSEQLMYLDTLTYLPGDILHKVDRAAMAVSLETRVPFLDPEVVSLAWRLPPRMKVREGSGKHVLKGVLERYVPRSLFERPKMGFGVPIDHWLRGPLASWAEGLLDEARLRDTGHFHVEPIRRAWAAHREGRENHQYALWAVLMFEAWRERWKL